MDGHADVVGELSGRVPHSHLGWTSPSRQLGPPPAHGAAEGVGEGWVWSEVGGAASACPDVLTSSPSSRAGPPPAPTELPGTRQPEWPPPQHQRLDLIGGPKESGSYTPPHTIGCCSECSVCTMQLGRLCPHLYLPHLDQLHPTERGEEGRGRGGEREERRGGGEGRGGEGKEDHDMSPTFQSITASQDVRLALDCEAQGHCVG